MKTEKESDNYLSEEVYTRSRLPLKVILPLFMLIPLVGFLLNFPLSSIITDLITQNLRNASSCPITFEKIETSLFFIPTVTIKKPSISGLCFKMPGQDLKLGDVIITFNGPSFYPPGLKFHAAISKEKSRLHFYPSISYNRIIVKITDSSIDSNIMNSFMSKKNVIKGQFDIEALVEMTQMKLTSANIRIKSNNLVIPGSNYNGFVFDTLDVGHFQAKITKTSPEKFLVNEFSLGGATAPINANFSGDILSNEANFSFSNLNLKGELTFSPEILNNSKYTFLSNLIFANYKVKNGAYQVMIGGTLEAPSLLPL